MIYRAVQQLDNLAMVFLGTSFIGNLINAMSEIHISSWFTVGSFVLAAAISSLKIRTFIWDIKIKKLQYKKLAEDENGESD